MKKLYSQFTFIALLFFAAGLLVGCGGGSEGTTDTDANDNAGNEMSDGEGTDAATESTIYVMYDGAGLRSEPGSGKGKWMASLSLSEKLTYWGIDSAVGDREFSKVRLVNGDEGWAQTNLLLMEGRVGAMLEEAQLYQRQDLLAKKGDDDVLPRMVVVGVEEEEGDWVSLKGIPMGETWYKSGWTKNPRLSYDEEDIALAVTVRRTMDDDDLSDAQKAEALRDAMSTFGNAVFAPDVAEMAVALEAPEVEEMADEMDSTMTEEDMK